MSQPFESISRSFLYCPGNQERKLARVFDFGADAVILDLEDAVPISEKARARKVVRACLEARIGKAGPRLMVRVNPPSGGLVEQDLDEVIIEGVSAIHLTKMGTVDEYRKLDAYVTTLEQRRGLPVGKIRFTSSIDSAHLALNVASIATSTPRLWRMVLGGVDFANDIGLGMSANQVESLWMRSYGVLVSRDAGLAPPIQPPHMDLNDEPGLVSVLEQARSLGFKGAIAVHPKQVPVINRVFTPTAAEVAWAKKVIHEFEAAEAGGSASIQIDGNFVDYAMVVTARGVLAVAEGYQAASKPDSQ